ncbi:response regulator [Desulfosporosinus fructosivorans]
MVDYILVVDDRSSIRRLLVEVLTYAGYESKQVGSGDECLNYARSDNKPALILLDNNMPGICGLDVLQLLKKDGAAKSIPVIMVSGENIEEQAKKQGAQSVLMKPFDIYDLIDRVQTVIK